MAWVYGWTMLPLTLFFAVVPPILSAPGAIAARGLDLPQHMMSAIASAALLALLGSVALNRYAMRAEHLIFMPVAAVLALPACLVDWAVTKRERLRQTPCWLQVVLSIALALAMIWIIQGVASILRDPPKPVWL